MFEFDEFFVNNGGGDAPVYAVLEKNGVQIYMDAVQNTVTNKRGNRKSGVSAVSLVVEGIDEVYQKCKDNNLEFVTVDIEEPKFGMKTITVLIWKATMFRFTRV